MWISVFFYSLLWLSFGALHSVLASESGRRSVARFVGRYERLAYNVIATVHLGAVVYGGYLLLWPYGMFELPSAAHILLGAVAVVGAMGILVALSRYDLGVMIGTTQAKQLPHDAHGPETQPLATEGMHRYVRHPLYAFALLTLLGAVGSPFGLASAVLAALYIRIGLVFEERKLVRVFGEEYLRYRARVPALVPQRLTPPFTRGQDITHRAAD
jgi:methanethiol S-methyltransferase